MKAWLRGPRFEHQAVEHRGAPYCPDFCPVMNGNFKQVHDALEEHVRANVALPLPSASNAWPIRLRSWRNAPGNGVSPPNWHFLTGSCDEIDRVTQAYGIPVQQTEPQVHIHPDGTPHARGQDFGHLAQALLGDLFAAAHGEGHQGSPDHTAIVKPFICIASTERGSNVRGAALCGQCRPSEQMTGRKDSHA